MGCGCCNGCRSGGACERFTSPERSARAAGRLGRLWDKARDLKAKAGLRPYSVAIVRARSAAGRRRGDGVFDVVGEWQILPTPKVSGMGALSELLNSDQLREMGTIMLSEISISYTEDMLLGRGPDGVAIGQDETVFYEVRWLAPNGSVTQRRRFVSSSPPDLRAESAEWVITLTRAPHDRERGGGLR